MQVRQSFSTPKASQAVCDSSLHVCREACKLDPKYITNFGEEVVRGQPVFVLSLLLQRLEPMLREAAGVAPWQVTPFYFYVSMSWAPRGGQQTEYNKKALNDMSGGYFTFMF